MELSEYISSIKHLFSCQVEGLNQDEKTNILYNYIEQSRTTTGLFNLSISIIPFIPGRPSFLEQHFPGLGSSDKTGIIQKGINKELTILYHLLEGDIPIDDLSSELTVSATIFLVNRRGESEFILPSWSNREIANEQAASSPKTNDTTLKENSKRTKFLHISIEEIYHDLNHYPYKRHFFGFSSMFFENFKLQLNVKLKGQIVASATHRFQIFNVEKIGTLYSRLLNKLLVWDIKNNNIKTDLSNCCMHPFYPAFIIGRKKMKNYFLWISRLIASEELSQGLSIDPQWLLEIGVYLEFLTFLGLAEAAKEEGLELLTSQEKRCFEKSDEFIEIRKRIDKKSWRKVWTLRKEGLQGWLFRLKIIKELINLFRKKVCILEFLRVHHEDLKMSIEMTEPNPYNSQEVWLKVFRDAEIAVLQVGDKAFPELGAFPKKIQEIFLWHEKGRYFSFKFVPNFLSGLYGDQNGIFVSACRSYRDSMNNVACWAKSRKYMDYTGEECIPITASILEEYLIGNKFKLHRLKTEDGYQPSLGVTVTTLSTDEIKSLLQQISFFQILNENEIDTLSLNLRPIALSHLERILIQDRPGTSMFIVSSGTLEVIVKKDDKETVIAQLKRGDIIGENSFLTGEKRNATVRAINDAIVLEVPASNFRFLMEHNPSLNKKLTHLWKLRKSKNLP